MPLFACELLKGPKRYYLLGVIDDCTRIAWCEVIPDLTSLTVMFAAMRCFQMIDRYYHIKFKEVITDNGSEFGQGKSKNNEQTRLRRWG